MLDLKPRTHQKLTFHRRQILFIMAAAAAAGPPSSLLAQERLVWSAKETQMALLSDEIRLIDVRSREEWIETGVALGAWPISLHEPAFETRLFEAHNLADGRIVALICATGGRSGTLLRALRRARYIGFIDVAEGMLGSPRGPGWISAGLPLVTADVSLASLPSELA